VVALREPLRAYLIFESHYDICCDGFFYLPQAFRLGGSHNVVALREPLRAYLIFESHYDICCDGFFLANLLIMPIFIA